MAEILLTSETFVKSVSNISDNVAGKYLLPSIREAQEIHLQGILGSCLLLKLKFLFKANMLRGSFNNDFNDDFSRMAGGENQPYKELIDRCQYYLAYMSIVELIDKVSFKVTNFGLAKTRDDNVDNASYDDLVRQKDLYRSKADHQAYILQGWLLKNRSFFPELAPCDCERIKSNLYSSASCGIFLGGARGRRGWR